MLQDIQTAYVLAGGQSRRLGQDKLFVSVEGESLLARAIRTCGSCFTEVVLVAPDRTKLRHSPLRVVTDYPYAEGPMAGIIAAILDTSDDCCFVTAVDLFDLSEELIRSLVDSYCGQQYLGVKEQDRIQPLCGIYHRSCLSKLLEHARQGNYQMHSVLNAIDSHSVPLPAFPWRNINRPADLRLIGGSVD